MTSRTCSESQSSGTCRAIANFTMRCRFRRKGPLETATLAVLQEHILTDEHVRVFIEELERELQRLTRQDTGQHDAAQKRLKQVTTEIENLYQNLLAGLASPALRAMIAEREAEKVRGGVVHDRKPTAILLPHPVLVEQFRSKVASLRQSLDDALIRTEAAAVLSALIESVTIFPDEPGGPEAEVAAKVSDLPTWATNDNAAPRGGDRSSIAVVAGTGFEPVTFRL